MKQVSHSTRRQKSGQQRQATMTMIETETIICPACNTQQETTVYQTINAMENPELMKFAV